MNVLVTIKNLRGDGSAEAGLNNVCIVECNNVVEQGLLGALLGQTSQIGLFCIRGLSLDFDEQSFRGSRYKFDSFQVLFN